MSGTDTQPEKNTEQSEDSAKVFPIGSHTTVTFSIEPKYVSVKVKSKENEFTKRFSNIEHAYAYYETLKDFFTKKEDE